MAFTSRWSARLTAGWPKVRVLRVFTPEGTRAWEIHLTPRSALVVDPPAPAPSPPAAAPSAEPPVQAAPVQAPLIQAAPIYTAQLKTPQLQTPQLQTWFSATMPATELPRRPTAASHATRRGLSRPSPYSQPPHAPPVVRRDEHPADASPADTPAAGRPAASEMVVGEVLDEAPVVETPAIEAPAVEARQPVSQPNGAPAQVSGPAVYIWVQLRQVHGEQDADCNRLVSRYMVTIHATVDLAKALGQSQVNDVLYRLARDSEDRRLRDDLVAELTAVPCPPRFATTIFDLSTLRTTGDENFLDGLLVIRNQGIQVGEPGLEPNRVTYIVTPTLAATRFLEGDPELAGALADHLCPSPSGSGKGAELDGLLRDAIDGHELTAANRPRPPDLPSAQRRAGSERGTVLRIEHLDGVLVGSRTVRVKRHIVEPRTPGNLGRNGVISHPTIDDPDRILELDRKTIDLHPSLGEYLAALSDHIGYEIGTRSDSRSERNQDADDSDFGDTGR